MTPHKILVTGGAGFIGSNTVRQLLREGYDVTVVDNLSKGHRHNVPRDRLYEVDILDTDSLTRLIRKKKCEAVIHFAAFIAVGESMREPARYLRNNVAGSVSLLEAMVQTDVKHIVFSSTAAVYGNPHTSPVGEDFPIQAVSPYGESKVMVETMLGWFDRIHHLTSICLRYFNASGADPGGGLGEEHDPETHLIPLIFHAIQTGNPITVFGNDYPTPDGTCIRDYIHVNDLAQAHILALDSLLNGGPSDRFNVGTGTGHTVLETIRTAEEVTGKKVPYVIGPRRDGDPPALVASPERIRERLGWSPKYAGLHEIIEHAWRVFTAEMPRR